MAGSGSERRAAEIVADAFERAGLSAVETRPFEMAAWERRARRSARDGARTRRRGGDPRVRGARAAVLAGRECHWGARGRGVRTPAETTSGRLRAGSQSRRRRPPEGGRFVHRMEKFGYALDAGAVGFVFVNHLDGQLPHRIP